MSYNLTAGYSLGNNDTAPGLKSIWINEGGISGVTETADSITAFTGASDNDAWYEFECALGEGQLVQAGTAGSGGKEIVSTLTYRIGGLSQAKQNTLEELIDSSRLHIVAEYRNGDLYYISRNGLTANADNFDSGVSGGGASAVGTVVTFTAHDVQKQKLVDLGSNADLDAITS